MKLPIAAEVISVFEDSLTIHAPFRHFTIKMVRVFFLLIIGFIIACTDNSAPVKPSVAGSPTPPATGSESKKMTTAFDSERAFGHVKKQVEFGPRPAGSAAIEKTRQYILDELKAYGLKTSLEEFTASTPRGKVKFKNIIAELPGAELPGERSSTIILASHYDTKPFKDFIFVGANDGGSSTGVLLEIARVMAIEKRKSRFTYQFVFFDGEEAFCREWGECLN